MIVYKVENKINGKVYIGKTIKSLTIRKNAHKQEAKRMSPYYFHQAIRKYGFENFEWVILQLAFNTEKLSSLEKFYINLYNSNKRDKGYNLTNGGEGSCGYVPSEETKLKTSQTLKGRVPWNKGLVAYNKGKKHSEESKLKMSKSHKGKKLTKTHIENIRKVVTGENNPRAILNNPKVRIIKFLLKRNDMTLEEIAYFFDVNKTIIYDIKRNKNWKNI
jgi:group I intron endonuclease